MLENAAVTAAASAIAANVEEALSLVSLTLARFASTIYSIGHFSDFLLKWSFLVQSDRDAKVPLARHEEKIFGGGG